MTPTSGGLARLEQAERMLHEIRTATDAANVADYAEAIRVFAKQARLGTRAINHATGIKLKAERRLAACVDEGQANGTITKHGGDRTKVGGDDLADLGLKKQQVHESRLIAEWFPTDQLIDAALEDAALRDVELSRLTVLREARNQRRRDRANERSSGDPGPLPGGLFDLIIADPPWVYPESTVANTLRANDQHYPDLSYDDIAAMDIPAAPNCVLLLWATSPLLPQQLAVMDAWGFVYRTCAVWVKDRIGMGEWWRQQHELILLGVRGKPGTPLPEAKPPSVLSAPRREHSRKPDQFHEMAESMFPHLTARLELFARTPRPGWETWGNDVAVAG